MIPVVTPARMAEIDAAAVEPTDVLIERAGAAVARAAVEAMGGRYGRRVVVLAGPGNNGADGRAAARRLRRRGVRALVFSATDAPETLPPADLYIDAAFGTGLSRPYTPPARARPEAPVLAVDIPSGLDGLTGEVLGGPVGLTGEVLGGPVGLTGEVLGGPVGLTGEVLGGPVGLTGEVLGGPVGLTGEVLGGPVGLTGEVLGGPVGLTGEVLGGPVGLTGEVLGGPVGLTGEVLGGPVGLTGEVLGGPVWSAQRTVTFAALKPGLLFGEGPAACGETAVADIGLSVGDDDGDACALVTDGDVESLPAGTGTTHKWHAAVLMVAGSPGMGGAASLACEAALRSGARMVHLSAPAAAGVASPIEVVRSEPPLAVDAGRFAVYAAGPGLGTGQQAAARLGDALALGLPAVIDADGLRLLRDPAIAVAMDQRRSGSVPTVLTPHDAELEALAGSRPGPDRIAAARAAAAQLGAVVLLKGGPTVVADPDGRARIVSSGNARLATAGTGDVLTGMIAGRLAAFGPERLVDLVAEAAHLHGRAASSVGGARLIASDLLGALRAVTP